MKHFRSITKTALVLALAILAIPAFAGTNKRPNEVGGAFAWVNSDTAGRTWNAHITLDAALGDHFAVGPVVDYFYSNPKEDTDSGSTTVINAGGEGVWYFFSHHNGPHLGASATFALQDASGYLLTPFVGLEFGNAYAALRIRYSHPFQMSEDHDTIDLERNEITAGGVFRF